MKEFFLWAFFNRDGLPGGDDEELEEYIVAAERQLGRTIDEGRGSAACLRLTLDPVNMLHRSILWYSVCLIYYHSSLALLRLILLITNSHAVCRFCRFLDLL